MSMENKIAKFGKRCAEMGVNSFCPWVLYIPKAPEKVQKLKKKL